MVFHLSRRRVLQLGWGGLAGWLVSPFSRPSAALGASPSDDVLVFIPLVGGFDGLSAVVPVRDVEYYRRRPTLAVPPDRTLPLDGHFGLHPALAPLHSHWRDGRLALVHAVAPLHRKRTLSHFAAIDALCRGTTRRGPDGWIDRYVEACGGSALHLGPAVPGTKALDRQRESTPPGPTAQAGARYPDGTFGSSLRELAARVRSDPRLRVATVACGGWDTHEGQGATDGWLADRFAELASGLDALVCDLRTSSRRVTVVAVSEFGRAISENALGGTEHGSGSVMLVLGERVRGGRFYGRWPGLHQDRADVLATTDPGQVLADFVQTKLGRRARHHVFPASDWTEAGLFTA